MVLSLNGLHAQRHMETLDRGLIAVESGDGVFLSWRLQGYEWYGYTYNVYRDGVKINTEPW
ncbi:predicted rhamnogalacturonan lyase in rhamnose utilization cluster [Geofilum rubicundum JCM 15548]|uniref:Predicted rhamnogalacturonan lyase in rhamnose utilization cluster n=2 Tax=Geofilum TaxID=1236988 RepID=A0A0E9LVX4_9BACT|nr:predicted rhamnogalacturonan lyase in rhamnose utilization cluster [Geofilum rubicundum JCM 15548]